MFDLDIHLVGGGFKDSEYFMLFLPPKIGGNDPGRRIDHQVVWNDT